MLSFEPVKSNYLKLLNNAKKDRKWNVYERVALGFKPGKAKLYVSENIMNIFNLELKKQINEIKNFAKFTDILIDENLGYNNFYIE